MSCRDPELAGLIGPYVLGACGPEEEQSVQQHLLVCESCRQEFESLAPVRVALLDAPPAARPGPAMKDAIMARVREEASLFEAAQPAGSAPPAGVEPSSSAVPPASPRRSAFASALLRPTRIAALAAVLVAVIVGVAVLGNGGSSSPDQTTVQAQVVRSAAPKGKADMVMTAGKPGAKLELSDFPAAGNGRQYQVWLQSGSDAPRPTKVLFDVDESGHATAEIPQALDKVDNVLVTSEPAGGSPAPTRNPVVQAAI